MSSGETQRVALVTSGAVRLGRAISLGLVDAGYDLVAAYRSSADAAKELEREVADRGRQCRTVEVDLSDPGAADELADAVEDSFDRLDVLVNSAATFRSVPLLDVDADEWARAMDVNARAPHLVVRALADRLRASGGSVINMTDLGAFQAWTEFPHHAVSKAALVHLTRIQARVLAPDVRVNAIAPGAVLPPDDWGAERWDRVAQRAALERVGTPEDIVRAVHYLIQADFVTGQVLAVDGGRLLGERGPAR